MRAFNYYGLLGLGIVVFGACGGESDLSPDGPGSEAGEAGFLPGEGGSGGEVSGAGMAGDATSTGGKAAGGTGGTGGKAGTTGGVAPTGGRPTAGAPSMGGGKSMPPPPEAGQPNVPNPPDPPEGCEPQSLSTSPYDCSLQLLCEGNEYVYTSCGNQNNGSWYCSCQTNKSIAEYSVTGLAGSAACTAIADFCVSGEIPNPGPEECTDVGSSRTASYCAVQETCVRPFELEGGVEAGLSRSRYASCSQSGTGNLCYCQNGYQYQISGQDGTTACDTLLELCEDPDPDIGGEFVCTPQFTSGGAGYCETQLTCTQTAEVADGVFATFQDNRYVSCSSQGVGGSGRSVCNCSSNNTSMRFDVDGSVTDVSTCSNLADACVDPAEVELSGPVTCAPAFQSAEGTSFCSAQIDCTQAGTIGDLDLYLYGSLNTSCQMLDGKWTCSCSTNTQNEQIEVNATSAWDACTAAVETCPDVVEVKIGENFGGGIPRPPFPG